MSELHGKLIYEEVSILTVIGNRRWKATYEHHRFGTLVDGLEFATIVRSYPGLVTPNNTGDFQVNTRPNDGAGWDDHFWHVNTARTATEPMQDQTRYDLRFRVTPFDDEHEPEPMILGSRALHERALLFTTRVGSIGEQPANIWKFDGARPFARPHAANEYNRTQLDTRGTASLTLCDVHGVLFSGFSWNWDS